MDAFIIMLSYAKDIAHYNMTQRAIDSIHASSIDTKFRVVVFETAKAMPHEIPIKPVAHSGLVKVDADGNFVWDGDIYRAPNVNLCSIWVDDLAGDEIIANGSFLRKKNPRPVTISYGGEIRYVGADTIPIDGDFNYNKCVNLGVCMAKEDTRYNWVVVMNNDILAHAGWFEELANSGYKSCSPISPGYQRQEKFLETTKGYIIGEHVSGWCIATNKDIWDKVFPLDERYFFWAQDCAYSRDLYDKGIDHAIVPNSKVTHLLSQTLPGYNDKVGLLESVRRLYNQFPKEWDEKVTGFHSPYWDKEEVFDNEWTRNFESKMHISGKQQVLSKAPEKRKTEKRRAGRPRRKKHNE